MQRSNRTFMELKSKSTKIHTIFSGSSNRTFMELKLSWFAGGWLLLATSSNRTFMELK